MRMQRTCLSVQLRVSSKPCFMPDVSSHTMSTTFLAASKRMVSSSPTSYQMRELYHNINTSFLGTGAVYSFDPVGSYEREACRAAGAAQSLVQPFLDNQVSTSFLISRTNRICKLCNSFLCLLRPSDSSPISYCVWIQQIHPSIHPTPPSLFSYYTVIERWKYLLTDLLQEPNACSRNVISQTFAIVHRAAPRDRLIHKCDRKTH
jgi:hypothetical protein